MTDFWEYAGEHEDARFDGDGEDDSPQCACTKCGDGYRLCDHEVANKGDLCENCANGNCTPPHLSAVGVR